MQPSPLPAAAAPPSTEKLGWLQALRGFAALMVVLFHASDQWPSAAQLNGLVQATKLGFSGVDIFFVLSGFVAYHSTRKLASAGEAWRFLKRRFARIYFLYWPTVLVFGSLVVWFTHKTYPDTATVVGSLLLAYPDAKDNWLHVAWSLTYELYFYVVFAVLLLFKPAHRARWVFACAWFVLVYNYSWLVLTQYYYLASPWLRFAVCGFSIEFMAGALLAAAFLRAPQAFTHTWKLLALSVALVWAGLQLGSSADRYANLELFRAVSFGVMGVGALLAALALQATKLRPPRALVALGDMSFSLYLLHPMLLDLIRELIPWSGHAEPAMGWFKLPLMAAALLLVTWAWHRTVERASLRLARSV